MKTVTKYYRDHEELSYEEWCKLLDMDMYIEQKNCYWQLSLNEGETWLNEHVYYVMHEDHYDTAKELIHDMLDYDDAELLDAVAQFSERECQMMLNYISRARIEAEYFVLKERAYD